MRRPARWKNGKVAVVTGASKGLGRRIAKSLRDQGYQVANGSRTSATPLDVRHPSEVARFLNNVLARFGRIDVAVNSAGYVHPLAPLSMITNDVLLDSFRTNLFGPFFVMRKVIPIMMKQGEGIIVNIASKAAVYTVPRLGPYSASKAALVSLTEAAAKELRNTNVFVVVVCPSGLRTKVRAAIFGKQDALGQQSPQRVATFVTEIVRNHTANGYPVGQGACVVIRKEGISVREMKDG